MMYYRISKNEKNLFFGKKIAQVWAVTLLKPILNIYDYGVVIHMKFYCGVISYREVIAL